MTPVDLTIVASLTLYYMCVCYFCSRDCYDTNNNDFTLE